jgi:hypothetical protein
MSDRHHPGGDEHRLEWGNNIDSHHNVGVAATGNATYFAWQDSRNGDPVAQAEDIYMTKLARFICTQVTAAAPGCCGRGRARLARCWWPGSPSSSPRS